MRSRAWTLNSSVSLVNTAYSVYGKPWNAARKVVNENFNGPNAIFQNETPPFYKPAVPFQEAVARGSVDRRATSQLMVISDADYESGLSRLTVGQPVLRTDLRMFATTGQVRAVR